MELIYCFHRLRASFEQTYLNLTGTQMVILILLLSVFYLIVITFQVWHQLSSFPGPFWASISYIPMFQIRRSGVSHLRYASLSSRYGSLVRIGPNDLLSADPDHLRRMSAARSPYERSSWYRATRLDPYHDMMGSTMDKTAHALIRSRIAAGYTGKDIPDLEGDLDTQVRALINLIDREYLTHLGTTTIPVNFGRLADFYARKYPSSSATESRNISGYQRMRCIRLHSKF